MRLKTLTLCVAILAALSAVAYIARRPGPPPSKDPRIGQPLLDRAAAEKAAKLQIADQGKTVTLAREADGTWRDTSYYDLPVDFSKLSGFIGNLTDAKIDRFVTASPERLSRLEFKDTKIELQDGSGKALWSVTLGKSAETGSGRFLKYDDEKKAYLATINAWIDTDAKSWANAELLNLKPDDIAKIEVDFPAAPASETEPKKPASPATTVTLSRPKKDAAWTAAPTPANEKVNAEKVSSLLNNVGNLRFTETNDLNDANVAAAKAHERTFKVTTFDGKTYTVAMGRKPEEKKLKPSAPKPEAKPTEAKNAKEPQKKEEPAKPEYETIPAGPVFVAVTSSDSSAPVNALMKKRAFQIGDYVFTSLPQQPADLFEAAPPPPPPPAPTKPAASASATKDEPKSEPTAPAKK